MLRRTVVNNPLKPRFTRAVVANSKSIRSPMQELRARAVFW